MIAMLNGIVSEKLTDTVIIECCGVGYGVYVAYEDHGTLATGEKAKLHIYEHIRENTHDLFGFKEKATKQLFELLLSVNGVGPKMALSILSIAAADQVKSAIASGDTKFIAQANGVGKRVAERVVVDLKDKVGLSSSSDATAFLQDLPINTHDEAAQGLMALGYSAGDAAAALKNIDATLPVEQRIKLALKN